MRSIALRTLLVTATIALSMAATAREAAARCKRPPPVPPALQVPAGNLLFLKGHALGTQNYVCLPAGTGFAWTFFAPQATLFDRYDEQIITHFLSPSQGPNDKVPVPRAAWQSSSDTSTVWAGAIANAPGATGAIPWLLLQVAARELGPTGGPQLFGTTFIHRINTAGGLAPVSGCDQAAHVGAKALVPYVADYLFYKPAKECLHRDHQADEADETDAPWAD
jgi:hypothetical protein